MIACINLIDWCKRYALRRGLRENAAYQLKRSCGLFIEFCGCDSTNSLDEDTVSEWIAWLESQEYAKRTIAGHRGNLLCLWRFIAEMESAAWPGRVRKAPIPQPQPVAWTLSELRAMRESASTAPGQLAAYFVALIDTAYETGLRRSDLFGLKRSQIRHDGIIIIRQNKTGSPHEPQLSDRTLREVFALPGDFPLRWHSKMDYFYRDWKRYVIGPAGVRHGALQQIRRTGATAIEATRPQDTSGYLGHRTPTMKRHYVDRSQAYGAAPKPPEL